MGAHIPTVASGWGNLTLHVDIPLLDVISLQARVDITRR